MDRKKPSSNRYSPAGGVKDRAIKRLTSAPTGASQSSTSSSERSRVRLGSDPHSTATKVSLRPHSGTQRSHQLSDSPGPLKHSASYTIIPDLSKRSSPSDLDLVSRSSSRNSFQDQQSPRSSSNTSEVSGWSARQSPFSPIGRGGAHSATAKSSLMKTTSSRHLTDSYAFLLDTSALVINRNRGAVSPRSVESEASLNAALLEAFNSTRASPNVSQSGKMAPKSFTQMQAKIKSFLTAGANPDVRDERGRPLIMVTLEGEANPILLKMLLEFGASPDLNVESSDFDKASMDSSGHEAQERILKDQTALQYASRRGLQHCVGLLLSAGADVNLADLRGNTALMKACKAGHTPTARTLLEHGASVTETNSAGQTALHLAVSRDHNTDCTKLLLEHGADPEAVDGNGLTALLVAAREGRFDLVETLMTYSTVDQLLAVDHRDSPSQKTALHYCAQYWKPKCVQLLIQRGADVNAIDVNWRNSLFLALIGQSNSAGTKADHSDSIAGDAAARMRQDVLGELIEAGAKVWSVDRHMWTSLHAAARSGNTDVIETVAMAGRDVMQRAQKSDVMNQNNDVIKSPQLGDRNESNNSSMKSHQSPNAIKAVQICEVMNIKSGGGLTPLMLATYYGHAGTVYKLLTLGASPELTDRFNATALIYALVAPERVEQRNGLYDTINLLFKYNCNASTGVSLWEMLYGNHSKHSLALDISERNLFAGIKHLVEPKKLYTPLEIAFLCGKSHILFKLVKFGCNPWHFDTEVLSRSNQGLDSKSGKDPNNNGNNNAVHNNNNKNNTSISGRLSLGDQEYSDSTAGGWLDKRTVEYIIGSIKERRQQVPLLVQLCRGPALKAILQKTQTLDSINSLSASRDVKRILMFLKTPGETGRQRPRSFQQKTDNWKSTDPSGNAGEEAEIIPEGKESKVEKHKKRLSTGRQLPNVVEDTSVTSQRLIRLATPARSHQKVDPSSTGDGTNSGDSKNNSKNIPRTSPQLRSNKGFRPEEKKMKPRFTESTLMMGT